MYAKKASVLLIAALLLAQLGLSRAAQANTVGKPASDFTLKTHDGKRLTLSKLKGKRGVVLDFFATWCPPCMAGVPHVKRFVEASRGKNVLVYGINIRQPLRVVTRFVRDKAVNYRVLLDSDAKVARAYGIRGIPTIIGIDAAGIVRYRGHALPRDPYAFIRLLTRPLENTPPQKKPAR